MVPIFLLCIEENETDHADKVFCSLTSFSLKKAHRVKINKLMILRLIGNSQYFECPCP